MISYGHLLLKGGVSFKIIWISIFYRLFQDLSKIVSFDMF